jgi:hypothetical protein
MARSRGQDFILLMGEETTYGVQPASPWRRLPCISFDLGAEQTLQTEDVLSAGLGREDIDPYLNLQDVRGTAVVPIDVRNIGYWLKGVFGPATVTGASNPYTHTWAVSGAQVSLPSRSFEKGFPGALTNNKYLQPSGVKIDSMEMTWTNGSDQRPTASFGLIGQKEAVASSSAGGTPTTQTYTRFLQRTGALNYASTSLTDIMSATLRLSNGLEPIKTVNALGLAEGVDEGQFSCSGEITVRHNDPTLMGNAINTTSAQLSLTWTYDANWQLALTLPRIFMGRPKVGVRGPGGVEVTYPWRAVMNSAPGDTLSVVLKSPVAVY